MSEQNFNRRNIHTSNMSLNADNGRAAGDLLQLKIAGVAVNFCWIPSGTFLMGSPTTEAGHWDGERQHEVTLTHGFWLAQTPTTLRFWRAILGEKDCFFRNYISLETIQSIYAKGILKRFKFVPHVFSYSGLSPVDCMSWYDCRVFIDELERGYRDLLPQGYKYSLPTEAGWEYACRAGTTTPFNCGDTLNAEHANCQGNYWNDMLEQGRARAIVAPVEAYPPNAWGLYGMHGNLWEWVADWYASDYYDKPEAAKDPSGPNRGTARVLRGGSWFDAPNLARSACRGFDEPGRREVQYGFRLALTPDA